jgi:hypothetical protein
VRRIARFLRKCADFIDPRVHPVETMTVRIECDNREALEAIQRVQDALGNLWRLVPPAPRA